MLHKNFYLNDILQLTSLVGTFNILPFFFSNINVSDQIELGKKNRCFETYDMVAVENFEV